MKTGLAVNAAAVAAALILPLAGAPVRAADQTEWLEAQLKVTDGYDPASRQADFVSSDRVAAASSKQGEWLHAQLDVTDGNDASVLGSAVEGE
jgi:hypothetical protein